MKKTTLKEKQKILNDKFEYLLETFICGNQGEIINFLNKSNKKIIIAFTCFLFDKYSGSFYSVGGGLMEEYEIHHHISNLFEYMENNYSHTNFFY